MAKELFRNANVSTIKSLMQTYTGVPLQGFEGFPKPFLVSSKPTDQWAQLELQYSDFKEAFCRFNLIARTCSQMDSYPQISNVYNKVVVKVYSTNPKNEKVLTPKDLYVCLFLQELETGTVDQAHTNALAKIQAAL